MNKINEFFVGRSMGIVWIILGFFVFMIIWIITTELTWDKRHERKKRKLKRKYPEVFKAYDRYIESFIVRRKYYYDNISALDTKKNDLRDSLVKCTFDERIVIDKKIEHLKNEIETLEKNAPYSKEQVFKNLLHLRNLISNIKDDKLKNIFYLDDDDMSIE